MKTKLLKFVRKNLYEYDGIWMVNDFTYLPLYSMLLCSILNNRRFYHEEFNLKKKKQ